MTDKRVGDRFDQVVTAGLSLVLASSTLYALASVAIPRLVSTARHTGHDGTLVAGGLLLLLGAGWSAAWSFAGPLAATPASLFWRARRDLRAWLRRSQLAAAAVALGGAVVTAAMVGVAAHEIGGSAVVSSAAVLAGLIANFFAVLWLQRRDLDPALRLLPVCLAGAGLVLATYAAWGLSWGVVLAAPLAAHVVWAGRGWRRRRVPPPPAVPRWQLVRAARNRWSVLAGVTLLDGEIIRVVGRRDRRAGHGRLTPWGRPPVDLAGLALVRGGQGSAAMALSALLGALVAHELLGATAGGCVLVAYEAWLAAALSRTAQAWNGTPSLARTLARPAGPTTLALALPAAVLPAVIGVAVGATWSFGIVTSVTLLLVPAAVVLRRLSGSSSTLGTLSSPMGAVPLDIVNRLLAGPDVAVVAMLLIGAALS